MGAGEAAPFSAALPWVLTATAPERRGRVAGWFGLSMWGGLVDRHGGGPVALVVLAVEALGLPLVATSPSRG